MHQPIAAGKLIDMRADDGAKGFFIGAKIIDDNEWKKVESGVYTGFSVGGSYERRWSDFTQPGVTRYTAKPTEISIVDAPCIPSATFQVIKADGLIEERQFKPGTGNLLKLDEDDGLEKWDEASHPRADDGKFGSGGGGGGGKEPEAEDKPYESDKETYGSKWKKEEQGASLASGNKKADIYHTANGFQVVLWEDSKPSGKSETYKTKEEAQAAGEKHVNTPKLTAEQKWGKPLKANKSEGGLTLDEKFSLLKSLATDIIDEIDTLQKADIPAAPEEIASIPLPSGVGPDYEVEHMPEPNATMALEMDGQPAQEVLAAHTVVTKDLSAAFDAWLPKVGLMFKAMIAEAIGTVQKSDSSNPAGQKIAVTNRNIKVTRKEN
jgi:hypothetical protein